MPRLNKCAFMGHLGQEPELKTLPSGQAVLSMRVAVNDGYKDKERTLWLTVKMFGERATKIEQYLHKGDPIYFDGRLDVREYERKDGSKGTAVEVVANEIQMLGGKRGGGGQERLPESGGADDVGDDQIPF